MAPVRVVPTHHRHVHLNPHRWSGGTTWGALKLLGSAVCLCWRVPTPKAVDDSQHAGHPTTEPPKADQEHEPVRQSTAGKVAVGEHIRDAPQQRGCQQEGEAPAQVGHSQQFVPPGPPVLTRFRGTRRIVVNVSLRRVVVAIRHQVGLRPGILNYAVLGWARRWGVPTAKAGWFGGQCRVRQS